MSIKTSHFDKEDKELYKYALKILEQWALNMIFVTLISVIMNMVKECLIMLLTFFCIRKFSGGFHCKSFLTCFLSSNTIIILFLAVIKYEIFNQYVIKIAFVISVVIICLFSPIENKNKPLSRREKHIYRLISLITLLIFILIMLGFEALNIPICFGVILSGFTVSLAKMKNIIKDKDVLLKKSS